MPEPKIVDVEMDDEYDEEADSDFDADSNDEIMSSSSEDEEDRVPSKKPQPNKKRKAAKHKESVEDTGGLDSGDEAALAEYKNTQKDLEGQGEILEDDSNESGEGWRARTRGMREREKDEKRKRRPAGLNNVTIDVEKMWKEMNRPGGAQEPQQITADEDQNGANPSQSPTANKASRSQALNSQDLENIPPGGEEEMITIKRIYKFAGQVTTEEKVVPKSSAEARLWLSQQSSHQPQAVSSDGRVVRRPLRYVSRFDPNQHNMSFFRGSWSKTAAAKPEDQPAAKKLNVVDKSRQDWAADVDEKGDREDLERHAKSKQGYLGQQDTLDRLARGREEVRLGKKANG